MRYLCLILGLVWTTGTLAAPSSRVMSRSLRFAFEFQLNQRVVECRIDADLDLEFDGTNVVDASLRRFRLEALGSAVVFRHMEFIQDPYHRVWIKSLTLTSELFSWLLKPDVDGQRPCSFRPHYRAVSSGTITQPLKFEFPVEGLGFNHFVATSGKGTTSGTLNDVYPYFRFDEGPVGDGNFSAKLRVHQSGFAEEPEN